MPDRKSKEKRLAITLVRSTIGLSRRHKLNIRALGLRRLNQTASLPDNDAVRGMVRFSSYYLKVEETR